MWYRSVIIFIVQAAIIAAGPGPRPVEIKSGQSKI